MSSDCARCPHCSDPCSLPVGHTGRHTSEDEICTWGEETEVSDNQKWCPDAAFGARCVLPLDHEPDTHYYARDAANRDGWTPTQLRPEETNVTWGQPFDAQPSRCPRTGGPGETRCTLPKGHTTGCLWAPVETAEPEACGEPDPRFADTVCVLAKGHDGDHSNADSLTAAELRAQSEDRATRIHRLEQALHADKRSLALATEALKKERRESEDLRKQRNACAARIVELEASLKKAQEESGDLSERNTKLCRELGHVREAAATSAAANRKLRARVDQLEQSEAALNEALRIAERVMKEEDMRPSHSCPTADQRMRKLQERVDQLEQSEAALNEALTKVNARYVTVVEGVDAHECPTADHSECNAVVSRLRRALNALLDD